MASADAGAILFSCLNVPEVADDSEESSHSQRCIDTGSRQPGKKHRPALEETAIAERRVDHSHRRKQRRQHIEAERFNDVSVEKRGKSASRSAARALDMEVTIDRTLRIEAI